MPTRIKRTLVVVGCLSLSLMGQATFARERVNVFTQSVIANNLSTRRAQLEAEITQHLAAGKISPFEAGRLRTSLDSLADLQSTYSEDGFLNNFEANQLVNGLAQVTVKLNQAIANAPVGPGRFGNRRGIAYGRGGSTADILRRIDIGLARGRITPAEAAELRRRYAQAQRTLGRNFYYRRGDRSDFDSLAGHIDRLLDTREANVRIHRWH